MAKRISKKIQNEEVKVSLPTFNTNPENSENVLANKETLPAKTVRTVRRVPKKKEEPLRSEQNADLKDAETSTNSPNTDDSKKRKRNVAPKSKENITSDSEKSAISDSESSKKTVQKNIEEKKASNGTKRANVFEEMPTSNPEKLPEKKQNALQGTPSQSTNESVRSDRNNVRNKRAAKGREHGVHESQNRELKNVQRVIPQDKEIGNDNKDTVNNKVYHNNKINEGQNANRQHTRHKSEDDTKNRHIGNKKEQPKNDILLENISDSNQQNTTVQQQADIQNNEQRRKKKRRNKKAKNRSEVQENTIAVADEQAPNNQNQQPAQKQHHDKQTVQPTQKQHHNKQAGQPTQKQHHNKQAGQPGQKQHHNKQTVQSVQRHNEQTTQSGQKQHHDKPVVQSGQKQHHNKQTVQPATKQERQRTPINKMGGKHVPALLEKPKNNSFEQITKTPDMKEVPMPNSKQKEPSKPDANKNTHRSEEKTKKNIKGAHEAQNKQVLPIETKSVEKPDTKNREKQPNKPKHQKHVVKEENDQLKEIYEENNQEVKNEKEGKNERNEQVTEQKQRHYDSGKTYIPIPLPQPTVLPKKQKSRHRAPQPLKIGNYSDFALSVIEKVDNFLLKSLSIPDGSSILLAVSGGVDSIVMADIFSYISSKHDFEVQVAHINHNLRGKESDDDERSVKGFCKRNGLRFHSARVQVKEYAKKNKISIETAARNLRYNSLDKQARSCAAEYVATAHTADDAAETFLFNIFRGAGITGLSGIPSERPLSKKINLVRPLLCLRKDEIVEYAKNRGLFWREDSSNTSLLYTRNKIRLKLLPHLRELFGNSVVEVVNRTASLMQGVDQVMQDLLDIFIPKNVQQVEYGAFSISLIGLKTQADFIKGEVFQAVLVHKMNQSNQPMATVQRIIDLCDADVNTVADVNGQVVAIRERDSIVLSKRKKVFEYYKSIFTDSEIVEKEWIVRLTILQKRPKEWANNPLIEYLDADLLPKQLTLRSWRNGDKFQPLGMQGHTSVSDFLTNTKVRALDRKKTLVLCAGNEIIWVLGKRISEQFRIKQSTQRIIKAELMYRNQNETEEK